MTPDQRAPEPDRRPVVGPQRTSPEERVAPPVPAPGPDATEPADNVQQSQPDAGSVEDRKSPTPVMPTRSKRTTLRTVLLTLMIVVVGLCATASVIGYMTYDRATKIDRSSPDVVVHRYVDAEFSKDQSTASLYSCGDASSLSAIQDLRADLRSKEAAAGVPINVSPENFGTDTRGNEATVEADLHIGANVGGQYQEEVQRWRFTLQDRSGWRVCGAQKTG